MARNALERKERNESVCAAPVSQPLKRKRDRTEMRILGLAAELSRKGVYRSERGLCTAAPESYDVQLVSDHFREEHGTEFYADRLCITPNYLNKIVRQSLGKSAKTYILDQILAEACRQLKYTTLPVADIAVQLHFDTATYFIRLFKKHMAMTPLEFREKG